MENLKRQFQEETKLSFDDIPINGVHLEYINWLEKRIKALSLDETAWQSEQLVCDYKYHNRDITTNGECTKCESHKWR
jgi:hypothetical protein